MPGKKEIDTVKVLRHVENQLRRAAEQFRRLEAMIIRIEPERNQVAGCFREYEATADLVHQIIKSLDNPPIKAWTRGLQQAMENVKFPDLHKKTGKAAKDYEH